MLPGSSGVEGSEIKHVEIALDAHVVDCSGRGFA